MFVSLLPQPSWVSLNQKDPVGARQFKPVQMYSFEELYLAEMAKV